MNGQETVGYSLGRLLLAGRETEAMASFFFKTHFINDCSEKLCAQDLSSFQTLGNRTCIASLALSENKKAGLLARVFQDKFHQ